MGAIGDLFNLIFTYPIFNGLVVLYHLFGDFALSIVVLTVIIKLILFPLTLQQLRSTKAMQALQPQIAEIRKKYGKDQQGIAQATQQLYKEYGVNPVAGCLPLLIQLPVLYGLFYALNGIVRQDKLSDINAHIYSFIPKFGHMPDLTFHWFSWLSFLHPILPGVDWTFPLNLPDPTHILPILAGLATFISLRMSQPKPVQLPQSKSGNGSNVADVSTQTMKTMQYIMPLFTVFIGWSFPAGLALYWTISSIFQAVQQYFVTGWGSLLATPSIQPKAASQPKVVESTISERSNNNKRQQEIEAQAEEVESDEEESEGESNGPIAQSMRVATTPRSGGSSTYMRRRKSSNSASARRRSAQKSRS